MRQTELKIGDWVSFDGTPVKTSEHWAWTMI